MKLASPFEVSKITKADFYRSPEWVQVKKKYCILGKRESIIVLLQWKHRFLVTVRVFLFGIFVPWGNKHPTLGSSPRSRLYS